MMSSWITLRQREELGLVVFQLIMHCQMSDAALDATERASQISLLWESIF